MKQVKYMPTYANFSLLHHFRRQRGSSWPASRAMLTGLAVFPSDALERHFVWIILKECCATK